MYSIVAHLQEKDAWEPSGKVVFRVEGVRIGQIGQYDNSKKKTPINILERWALSMGIG